jgi:hypothetical protein
VSQATVLRIWQARELKPHLVDTFKLSKDNASRRSWSRLEELLHPGRHQLTRCQPLAHQPAAQVCQQLQLACGARRRVALPDQLLTDTVSVRYERTCHAQST